MNKAALLSSEQRGFRLTEKAVPAFMMMLLWLSPIKAQVLNDSLNINELSHFYSDSLHLEFHPESHPSDSLFYRYIPSVDMELIADRASCLDLDIPLVVNQTVCSFIHYFTVRKRNYTQTMLERKNYYFPIFEYYLRKYEMPDALKYLAIVESGLNYKARSRVGAVGLWQFMPGTGRDFRLGQSAHLDQRQNPWLATEAACKFLKSLHGTFQDWEMALAAYNCGPGNVMKAIRRSGKKTFWEIYQHLPQETRSYVPQFHAVVYSMNYAREHNIFPDIDSVLMSVPLDTFRTDKICDLKKLEGLLGMPPRTLQHHNPELKTSVFPGGVLLVPGSHSDLLASNFDVYLDSARVIPPKLLPAPPSGQFVFLKKGTNLDKLAGRKGWDKKEFCSLNQISGSRIRKSGKYRIPDSGKTASDSARLAFSDSSSNQVTVSNKKTLSQQNNARPVSPPVRIVSFASPVKPPSSGLMPEKAPVKEFHEVKKGEGLYAIARMYGMDIRQMQELNPDAGKHLFQGQKLRIITEKSEQIHSDSLITAEKSDMDEKEKASVSLESSQTNKKHNRPRFYLVQKGDTLYSITRKFNRLTVKELIRINNLKNKQIKPGQQLIVG